MKRLSLDIEIAEQFDLRPGENLDKYGPFHITVAATVTFQGKSRLWYSQDATGRPAAQLTQQGAYELLRFLEQEQAAGSQIFAWNGLGFDFKWLGHHAEAPELASRVALKSYDPMFQFFNITGFPVALAKVAEGMGIRQRKTLHGSEAPALWAAGEHQTVMDYVVGDCRLTNQVVAAIERFGEVRWITARGTPSSKCMRGLKTVEAIIKDPPPDQSWMTDPPTKESFFEWLY